MYIDYIQAKRGLPPKKNYDKENNYARKQIHQHAKKTTE